MSSLNMKFASIKRQNMESELEMSEGLKQKIQEKIKEIESENDRILQGVNEDQQLPDSQAQAILRSSYFNNGSIQSLKDVLGLLDEATKQVQEALDRKTKDDFKGLLQKIAMSKGAIKAEHADQVLSDLDGNNHFVNVSWYFGLGYSYALREVLSVLDGEKK